MPCDMSWSLSYDIAHDLGGKICTYDETEEIANAEAGHEANHPLSKAKASKHNKQMMAELTDGLLSINPPQAHKSSEQDKG